jgi:glycosyltransferase involved in cell wall biosynthesis
MNILMLCTKYPLDPKDRYMTTELASALVEAGHPVTVVVTDWDAPYGAPTRMVVSGDNVRILAVAPRAITWLGTLVERATKWTLSTLFATRDMKRHLAGQEFDVTLAFTPCVTIGAQLVWAKRRFNTRGMLFVYDFFPFHHRSIGLVPSGPIFSIALWLEERLIRGFDAIGCNWPANITYLREHYEIRDSQRVIWTPLWAEISPLLPIDKTQMRTLHGLPLEKRIVVFGGQITEGRGVEEMLDVAHLARDARPDLAFLFVGDGRLAPLVQAQASKYTSNVYHIKRVPREDYLGLVSACDLGLVATVSGVDSSSFPTKTIDYLRANLPIVAAVEQDSDYRAFLEEWAIGLSVAAGSPAQLLEAIVRKIDSNEPAALTSERARTCLEQVFDVKRAVRTVSDVMLTATN